MCTNKSMMTDEIHLNINDVHEKSRDYAQSVSNSYKDKCVIQKVTNFIHV